MCSLEGREVLQVFYASTGEDSLGWGKRGGENSQSLRGSEATSSIIDLTTALSDALCFRKWVIGSTRFLSENFSSAKASQEMEKLSAHSYIQ